MKIGVLDRLALFRKWYRNVASYNGRRLAICMRSIKWWHFQWPWVTP